MLSNLITSLLLSCCIGASSFNHDHSVNTNNVINYSSPYGDEYVINGYFTNRKTTGFTFDGLNPLDLNMFYFYFVPSYEDNGFITGSYNYYNQGIGISGKHQQVIEKLSFWFLYDSGLNSWTCTTSFYYFDTSTQSYKWDNNYAHNPIIACKNAYLDEVVYGLDDYSLSIDTFLQRYFTQIFNMYVGDLGSNQNFNNPYFNQFSSNGGGYAFNYNFNPWLSWFSNPTNKMNFGVPSSDVYEGADYSQYNFYTVSTNDESNFFVDERNSPWELFGFDIFEGLFTYGGQFYTNIRIYFASIYENISYGGDYVNVEFYYNQFVYASFINTATDSEYFFLLTDGYKHYSNDFYKWDKTGTYNPSLSVQSNYRSVNNYLSNDAVQYDNLHWVSMPYINIIYSLNRPTNNYGFRSGSSFYDLLNFVPNSDNGDSPSGSTLNNLSNVFFLIRLTLDGIIPFFDTQVLPGISLGTLVFAPLVFVIIFAVIKLFKR